MDFVKLKQVSNDVVVIFPHGFLAGGEETAELEKVLFGAIDKGESPILDLSHVTFMNSSALQILFASTQKMTASGRRLKLCAMNKRVKRLFTVTMASVVFELFDTQDEAIASCAKV